jgi:hypothetical protein
VAPVPDPLLLKNSGNTGNRTQTSGSVSKNSDHSTTEAISHNIRDFLNKGKLNASVLNTVYSMATLLDYHEIKYCTLVSMNFSYNRLIRRLQRETLFNVLSLCLGITLVIQEKTCFNSLFCKTLVCSV